MEVQNLWSLRKFYFIYDYNLTTEHLYYKQGFVTTKSQVILTVIIIIIIFQLKNQKKNTQQTKQNVSDSAYVSNPLVKISLNILVSQYLQKRW